MTVDREELLRLKAQIRDDDPAVRQAAIDRVAEVLAAQVEMVTAEALQSDDPEVRERAARLLELVDEE